MSSNIRRRALAGATLFALLVGGASVAWACTRQATLTVSPAFGKAGSQTQVAGRGFVTGEPVEIRWNTTGGPVMGRAVGGDFSVVVTIPGDASNGVYYIVATAPKTQISASFEVRSAAATSSDRTAPPDSQTSTSANGSEATTSNASGQTSGTTQGGSGTTAGATGQSGDLGFAESQAQTSPEGTPAPAGQTASSPAQAGQPSTAAAPGVARSTASSSSAAPAPAGSPAAAAPQAGGQPAVPVDEQSSPNARSASADLWSGFSAGNPSSLSPGLDGGAPASSGATTPLALGVGLLSAGTVALGLGFGAAELRRKRALASQGA